MHWQNDIIGYSPDSKERVSDQNFDLKRKVIQNSESAFFLQSASLLEPACLFLSLKSANRTSLALLIE